MYDGRFEIERAEALKWAKEREQKFLNEWCKKAGVKEPIGYYVDFCNNKLIIYTNKIGYFIGKGGKLLKEYREKITKDLYSNIKDIEFIEIKTGFANYNMEVN